MINETTLGEADTPLLQCRNLATKFSVSDLMVKNETVNPTLSFKDRAMALGVSLARDRKLPGVVAASTGNTAVSAAAYAARAHIRCRIYCAATDGPQVESKLASASAYGATIEVVRGDYSSAHCAAQSLELDGWLPLTTTFRNPFLAEAHRTIAFELFEQTSGNIPDWVIVPVGAGPLLVGIYHGFEVLRDANKIAHPPGMVAVQSESCAPIVTSWENNTSVTAADPRPTMAEAIADPLRGYEDEGEVTLDAIKQSNGVALSVSDHEIARASEVVSRTEGLLFEPAAVAPIAALTRLIDNGVIDPADRVATLATGHGAGYQHGTETGEACQHELG